MTATTITPKISRRDFVNLAWVTLGGLAVLELGGVTLAYMQPRLAEGEFGSSAQRGQGG